MFLRLGGLVELLTSLFNPLIKGVEYDRCWSLLSAFITNLSWVLTLLLKHKVGKRGSHNGTGRIGHLIISNEERKDF